MKTVLFLVASSTEDVMADVTEFGKDAHLHSSFLASVSAHDTTLKTD